MTFFPVRTSLALSVGLTAAMPVLADVLDIGSRRELWLDPNLVAERRGEAELRLHAPTLQEIVLRHDQPWEGNASAYHSVFKDGSLYRMYYRGWQIDFTPGRARTSVSVLCYAESDDGLHWRRPVLGLHEFRGSKENNIVLVTGPVDGVQADAGHAAVFKDENPAVKPKERYKAIVRSRKPHGLLAFVSPDGLRWRPMQTEPVITDGAFDSQNLAFWDTERGEYRAYWRYFTGGVTNSNDWNPKGIRAIRTATSHDFVHWSKPEDLRYGDAPEEHLYTNAIKPYPRAPHFYIGFPQRYLERGWSAAMRALPDAAHRELRASVVERYGTALSEGLLMAGRDGVNFHRWPEAFIRPGIERNGTWNYPHLVVGWHLVETRSALTGAPDEYSLYAVEDYGTGAASALRRYTVRPDGFVSARAGMRGGEVVTRTIRFAGDRLYLNLATSAAGGVQVELQDPTGRPFPGFGLDDCSPLFGDTLDRVVTWKGGEQVAALAGKPLRMRLVIHDGDVFSFQFR
jgi:hypothetical protein